MRVRQPAACACVTETSFTQHRCDRSWQLETQAKSLRRRPCQRHQCSWRSEPLVLRFASSRDSLGCQQADAVDLTDARRIHLRQRARIRETIAKRQLDRMSFGCVEQIQTISHDRNHAERAAYRACVQIHPEAGEERASLLLGQLGRRSDMRRDATLLLGRKADPKIKFERTGDFLVDELAHSFPETRRMSSPAR